MIITYECNVLMIACPRPAEDQARWNLGMEEGGGHEAPSLPGELLAADDCSERESQVLSRMQPG